MSQDKTTIAGERTQRVHSAGWYYADNVPSIVQENIPAGRVALIDSEGRYGYQVYSGGGYCVQMLADIETLERTKAHFAA